MFLNIDKRLDDSVLAIDSDGRKILCGEVIAITQAIRNVTSSAIAFNLCNNSVGALAAYLGSVEAGIVPVMLSDSIDEELLINLFSVYEPAYIWMPSQRVNLFDNCEKLYEVHGYSLYRTSNALYSFHKDLQLLMTT